MENINYNLIMLSRLNQLANEKIRPKLLLHSCCGPCSTAVIERLYKFCDITVFYFNPCIFPSTEFIKRSDTQKQYIEKLKLQGVNIEFIEPLNLHKDFLEEVKGYENFKEGEDRCYYCFQQRLRETCKFAKNNGFDMFCTTLTVSPHKNCKWINEIGEKLAKEFDIEFLNSDFKKDDGFLQSTKLAKLNNLYRQDYCGCEFSIENKDK